MSIPLDRLYHYIENIANAMHGDVLIYRFWPHGSKKIENLRIIEKSRLNSWITTALCADIYCFDQEPLDYDLYDHPWPEVKNSWFDLLAEQNLYPENKNFLSRTKYRCYSKSIILHSELRSQEVKKYQSTTAIPVYYWSHGIIARDWFRFAAHACFKKNIQKNFLIYNRAWSGTREYRLKFFEQLINSSLIDQCHTAFNARDPETGIHHKDHVFKNSVWKPMHISDNAVPVNTYKPDSSADFEISDYNETRIELVLETLFDDSRLHLTEKTLRPLACKQPFILMATHGSLEYLKRYGFKTFDSVWDESYDQIQDPAQRLTAVINLMQEINSWSTEVWQRKQNQLDQIVTHNHQRFFSEDFFLQISQELQQNLTTAFEELNHNLNLKTFQDRWNLLLSNQKLHDFLSNNKNPKYPNIGDIELAGKIIQERFEIYRASKSTTK
jgi:hypothetical protein